MSIYDQARELNERRMNIWNQAKDLVDRAERQGGLRGEDRAQFERMNADIDRLDLERVELLGSDAAKREIEGINEEAARVLTPAAFAHRASRDDATLRDFLRPAGTSGGVDALNIDLALAARASEAWRDGARGTEFRTYVTDVGGGSLTVPTEVATTIYAFMVNGNAIRRVARVETTPGGNPMSFPRVTTHSVATQIATQDTAITAGSAVIGNMVLNAYDYGQLSAVSNDMLQDSGVDVISFVGEQIGRSLGIVTGQKYATGTGSGEPTGIITAAPTGSGGTVATGGTTIAGVNAISGLVDPFIDLQYSVADSYRMSGRQAFVVHQSTIGVLRKQRETGGTAGAYLWSPSPTAGMANGAPDRFLGDPIYSDANIASIASNAKIAVYGSWDAFYIRDVNGLRLERSNDLLFNLNQVAFRGVVRTDSGCVDSRALNVLKMSI